MLNCLALGGKQPSTAICWQQKNSGYYAKHFLEFLLLRVIAYILVLAAIDIVSNLNVLA
jgi:hypothetical protein